jgi:peptide/nickel transport system ATP-binding protein
MPVCRERFPGRTSFGNEHWTHCFLYGEGEQASAATTQASTLAPAGQSHQAQVQQAH